MTSAELQSAVDQFHWYHEIDVGQGVQTKPRDRYDVSWDLIRDGMATIDFKDKRVLDIGTRDGKYAFEVENKGAVMIHAIDNDLSKGAMWLADHWKSKVKFMEANLYDVKDIGTYDVVLFFGVLYHLRYPMCGLRRVSQLVRQGGKLCIETAIYMKNDLPLLYCPVHKSPYEQTSCSFFNLIGLNETLWSFGVTIKEAHPSPAENGKMIQRHWIEAEKTHEMPEQLQKYWESIHASHD